LHAKIDGVILFSIRRFLKAASCMLGKQKYLAEVRQDIFFAAARMGSL